MYVSSTFEKHSTLSGTKDYSKNYKKPISQVTSLIPSKTCTGKQNVQSNLETGQHNISNAKRVYVKGILSAHYSSTSLLMASLNAWKTVTLDGAGSINALAYADDIVLTSSTKEGLQKALDATQQYCHEWRLKINHQKTKCMTFTRGTQNEKTAFKIDGENLENTREYKYLGIMINKKNCTFAPAIKALRIKATRALYVIKAKLNINKLPIRLALKVFDSLVKPILLYASETWEPFLNNDYEKWDHNEIEKVHAQFLKQILGVNSSTTNILVRGELNRYSLQCEVLKRHIRYVRYITTKERDSLVTQALNYEINRDNHITFLNTIYRHTEVLQRAHRQFLPYKYPHNNILDISEDKLKTYTWEIFNNTWKSKLEISIKGETYKGFKNQMRYEPFLDHLSRKLRRTLLKFRLSDHKLMIEEGRHFRPKVPRENRWCKYV